MQGDLADNRAAWDGAKVPTVSAFQGIVTAEIEGVVSARAHPLDNNHGLTWHRRNNEGLWLDSLPSPQVDNDEVSRSKGGLHALAADPKYSEVPAPPGGRNVGQPKGLLGSASRERDQPPARTQSTSRPLVAQKIP